MFRYETHTHTYPVSKCARASVRKTLEDYKRMGYTGLFITNHFLDGNINIDPATPYEEKIRFYCSDYEEAKALSEEIGIRVFFGVEITYLGTDFLVYGVDKEWFLSHPEVMEKDISDKLQYYRDNGALVIQAHPYREDPWIDHIRLFPARVDGVEVFNAGRPDLVNRMAAYYAKEYGLLVTAGTDSHDGGDLARYGGMETDTEIEDEADFIRRIKEGSMRIFSFMNPNPVRK